MGNVVLAYCQTSDGGEKLVCRLNLSMEEAGSLYTGSLAGMLVNMKHPRDSRLTLILVPLSEVSKMSELSHSYQ